MLEEILKDITTRYPNTIFKVQYVDDSYYISMNNSEIQHSEWFVCYLGKIIKEHINNGKDFNMYFDYDSQL